MRFSPWKHWPVSRPPSSNGDLWLCHVSGCRRAAGGQLNQGAIVSRRRNSQETSRETSPGAKLNILSFVDHFVNFSFASSWFQWLEAWWKVGFDPQSPPHPRLKKSKINEYTTAAAMLKPVYFLYILRYENIKVPSAFHSTFSGIRAPTRNGLVCLILKLGHIFQIMKLFIQQYLRQNFHCRV